MRCKAQTLTNRQCRHTAVFNELCIIHLHHDDFYMREMKKDIAKLKKLNWDIKHRIDLLEEKLLTKLSGWQRFKTYYHIARAVKLYSEYDVKISLLKNELEEAYFKRSGRTLNRKI